MKLFFDENLSSRLVHSLAALYPGSEHVQDRRLDAADDAAIWDFARANGFTIASKDSDFYDHSVLLGSPPKVIWLKVGNCSTDAIEALLRKVHGDVTAFIEEDFETCLMLTLK